MPKAPQQGFTLIEMSIMLAIIGLIVGGVLVGRSLINAAAVRAQISQIEKYQTAVNTFYGKYGYLPGDIPAEPAAQFGSAARGSVAGEGDGNGIIQGNQTNAPAGALGYISGMGETPMVWVDLSKAGLIDESFTTASPNTGPASVLPTALDAWFPQAKIENGIRATMPGHPEFPGSHAASFALLA